MTCDPNLLNTYDRCLPLQVSVNVMRFTSSFNQSVGKGWGINLAESVVCNLGEWLSHLSKLLASVMGSKPFEKPIERQRDA